jgi:hypothetical protein
MEVITMTTLRFADLHSQVTAEASFSEGTPLSEAIPIGVERLGAPSTYSSGEPISYRARDASTGALLGPEQNVDEVAGEEKIVQLIAEIPAA